MQQFLSIGSVELVSRHRVHSFAVDSVLYKRNLKAVSEYRAYYSHNLSDSGWVTAGDGIAVIFIEIPVLVKRVR